MYQDTTSPPKLHNSLESVKQGIPMVTQLWAELAASWLTEMDSCSVHRPSQMCQPTTGSSISPSSSCPLPPTHGKAKSSGPWMLPFTLGTALGCRALTSALPNAKQSSQLASFNQSNCSINSWLLAGGKEGLDVRGTWQRALSEKAQRPP